MARRQERQPDTVWSYGLPFFPAPGGEGKSRLGGELRHEEHRLSRTGQRVDRDGTVDESSRSDVTDSTSFFGKVRIGKEHVHVKCHESYCYMTILVRLVPSPY
jgi:hypothetical protein